MSKRFISIVCLILAVVMVLSLVLTGVSVYAVTQSEIDELERQRDEIRTRLANIDEQRSHLESDREQTMALKAQLDEQCALLQDDINLLTEQIELYGSMVEEKSREVDAAVEAEQEQYERYVKRLRAMEENDTWSYVSFLFKATSFVDLLSRLDDVTDIITHDQKVEEEYTEARESVEAVRQEYESIQSAQEAKYIELEGKQKQLEEDIQAASEVITTLEADIDAYTALYDSAESEREQIQTRIDEKSAELKRQQEEEEAARKRAAEAAAAAAAAAAARNASGSVSSSTTTSSGSSGGNSSSSGSGGYSSSSGSSSYSGSGTSSYAASGGYYMWPSYCTYITSRFGYRVHPIFQTTKYHSGVDIAASYGTAIYAAASGTVTIAESSTGYGNYVTIYHNNGQTTLYGHMSSIAVYAGQTVSQGDVIGYVGSTGYATGPHLHFEVRENGSCIDPLQYFNTSSFTFSSSA